MEHGHHRPISFSLAFAMTVLRVRSQSAFYFFSVPLPPPCSAKRWAPGCVNAAGQGQAVVVNNSSIKIHQTWGLPFTRALYMPFFGDCVLRQLLPMYSVFESFEDNAA